MSCPKVVGDRVPTSTRAAGGYGEISGTTAVGASAATSCPNVGDRVPTSTWAAGGAGQISVNTLSARRRWVTGEQFVFTKFSEKEAERTPGNEGPKDGSQASSGSGKQQLFEERLPGAACGCATSS
ncbi:hypothetical protein CYMTET_14749 [Cymbomonas tetramitiformis]|uniref:Uncharacterized protein n=1 Tax=Cymbomonas tetramitiformis TaxID=36881 RepID=A0AAE0L9Q2_9CHLO|nr:hypothetical protein CYMTET_14749 [Cymbomonas tetramitiformis]